MSTIPPFPAVAAAASLLLVATGCTTPAATPVTTATESAGYCDELTGTIQDVHEELGTPGVVVLVRSAELGDCSITFGTGDLEAGGTIGFDDQFRIGSNTKTMTGTVILQLVDEGLIALDDPVSKYREGVPDGDAITIEQLLNMRSGLQDYSGLPAIADSMDTTPGRVWTPDELLALSYDQPPGFPPGEGYLYSNANTVLLGQIIEQLTGMPVRDVFETRIFGPLGLGRTLLPAPDESSIPDPQHADGYLYGTVMEFIDSGGVLTRQQQDDIASGTLSPRDVTDTNPSWAWAAGGVISTTDELATFVEALVEGVLLSDRMQQERLASVIPVDPADPNSAAYGWGIAKYGPLYGHAGELPGYQSFMGHDPERDLTIIAWGNMMTGPDGRLTANVLSEAVIDLLYPE